MLQTDSIDAAGEATIRAHMGDIAERFTGIRHSVELLPRVPPPV